ncbi:MAG: hypothetical protein ABIJ08_06755 [Nanoarchaeota archaeon]
MEKHKGLIVSLTQEFDVATCAYYWVAQVSFTDKPDLTLGDCEVNQ